MTALASEKGPWGRRGPPCLHRATEETAARAASRAERLDRRRKRLTIQGPTDDTSSYASPDALRRSYLQPALPGFELPNYAPSRRRMYRLRDAVRSAVRPRCRACGHQRIAAAVDVIANEGRARFSGLAMCGSVWECPVCAMAIKSARARELDALADWHGRSRTKVLTLTLRHGFGDDTKKLRRALAKAWEVFCQGRGWVDWKEEAGIVGYVRALEVTYGINGAHPHLHVLFCAGVEGDDPAWEAWEAWLRKRWVAVCTRMLRPFPADAPPVLFPPLLERHQVPDLEHGANLADTPASYLAKVGIELSDAGAKEAGGGHRTPIQIADDYSRRGRLRDLRLWQEYARAFFGARFLTWSNGLRVAAGLGEDVPDEELLEAQPGDEWICAINGKTWDRAKRLKFRRPDGGLVTFPVAVLEAVEEKGPEGARELVEEADRILREIPAPLPTLKEKEPEAPRGPELEALRTMTLREAEVLDDEDQNWEYMAADLQREAYERVRSKLDGIPLTERPKVRRVEQWHREHPPRRSLALEVLRLRAAPPEEEIMPTPTLPDVTSLVLPHDLDAEAAVISAALLAWQHPAHSEELRSLDLAPREFYSVANRRIWEAIRALEAAGTPVDVTTVVALLRDRQRLEQVGGMQYLARMLDATPAISHVRAHAAIVREKYLKRALILACQETIAALYTGGGELGALAATLRVTVDSAERGEPVGADVIPLRRE